MSSLTQADANNSQDDKLFSESAERNKEPILHGLRSTIARMQTVLEIGSGSGQHAVYFAQHMPQITWQPSDLPNKHASIRAWTAESQLTNVLPPIALNIDDAPWSLRDAGIDPKQLDAVYSANTLHIISWPQVIKFFEGVGALLNGGGKLCVYGPFKYGGEFISVGDARFDAQLRAENKGSAIRDVEEVDEIAHNNGLQFDDDLQMPANNHLLVWRKM